MSNTYILFNYSSLYDIKFNLTYFYLVKSKFPLQYVNYNILLTVFLTVPSYVTIKSSILLTNFLYKYPVSEVSTTWIPFAIPKFNVHGTVKS